MGSLFRSEEMVLCQLFLQSEAAYACISEMGEIGVVQFRDLNPNVNAFQRKFVSEVRRCDEMERKLRYIDKEIKKDEIPTFDNEENPEAPQPREMTDLEAILEKLETELKEVSSNAEALKRSYMELTEMKYILQKSQVFFDEREQNAGELSTEGSLRALVTQDTLQSQQAPAQLRFVTGVILRERLPPFEQMLWRACRGNVFLRQHEIETPLEDPVTGDQVNKNVFIVFFQGEQLNTKVKKICEGFRTTLYPCPEAPADRRELAQGVAKRIEDMNSVLSQTQDHRHRVLLSASKAIRNWFIKVRKIKSIYHMLNFFNLDVTQKCLIAECWCPSADLEQIQLALRRGTERSGSTIPPILNRMDTQEPPPTFNRVNKFTTGFQAIVDAFGIGDYREVNPAPFTIITFPFLFAVMFGDAGHGSLMFIFALWMVVCEKSLMAKKIEDEIWNTFFGGRYIILLMGLFSIYTGLIYNDVFSKSINIFGTAWTPMYSASQLHTQKTMTLDPNRTDIFYGEPYPFGLDPVWQSALNKLNFLNSYKMKISVILGVIHMLFGVILSLWNHQYFKKPINIYCEFIPQVIFMVAIFGYLVVLVFWKWTNYTAATSECAPSLLIALINMCMMKYDEKASCSTRTFYAGQQALQTFFLVLALCCVPWMLLIKPFILKRNHTKKSSTPVVAHVNSNNIENGNGVTDGEPIVQENTSHKEEEFDFGEIFIHQCIHTIEYCLGCISNTASYLRLWALSLAHAQLSEVLWTMVMQMGLTQSYPVGGIMLFFIFTIWSLLTVAILIIMEGLSAFLHALRLHWVEFQNKFYQGSGYAFIPFSFEPILQAKIGSEE